MESSEERFREVYEQYKSRILGQIYAITGDYHQAEDICQETFLKMYDYMEMLDEEGLNRWLRVVSYNKTCDWLRRRKKYRELLEKNASGQGKGAENPLEGYMALLDDSDSCGHILEKLRRKNEKWYEILILYEYFGVPKREIAKRMGMPISTVDTYLRRCRKWLKENFSNKES